MIASASRPASSARVLPWSQEAEMSVVGGILLHPAAFAQVADQVRAEDFYHPAHAAIYTAMLELDEAGRPIDAITVADQMRATDELHKLRAYNGESYFTELTSAVVTIENIAFHARIVASKARVRRTIEAAQEIAATGYGDYGDGEQFCDEAEKTLFGATQAGRKAGYVPVKKIAGDVARAIEARYDRKQLITGVPSGLSRLDEMTAGWQPGDLIIIAGRPSMGKAQPLDSSVLTPTGWHRMGDLQVGDEVIGSDGHRHRITGVFPQGRRPVFRVVFSDGGETRCCNEHLWFTQTKNERRRGDDGSVRSLAEIRRTLLIENATRANHRIPVVAPVVFDERATPLPLHPYLLGLYLGDGSSSGSVIVHNPEADIQQRVAGLLPAGDEVEVADDGITCRVRKCVAGPEQSQTKQRLVAMGLSDVDSIDKFIPDEYLMASIEERLELLRGLLDTDGYVVDSGQSVEFSTSSARLAEQVAFLVRSLGGIVSSHNRIPRFTYRGERREGAKSWRLNLWFPNYVVPVSSEKHLERWKPGPARFVGRSIVDVIDDGETECQCIKVDADDELYVTDDFVVTHNTSLVMNAITNAAIEYGVPALVFSLEMSKEDLVERMASSEGRIDSTRLRSGQLEQRDWIALTKAMSRITQAPIDIDDDGSPTVADIRARARRWRAENPGPNGIIAVDYLTLIDNQREKGQNEASAWGDVSRGLKSLAKELRIPLIALSQLNRAVEDRKDKRPVMSDLRESGAIEQDADVIAFIYRDEVYNKESNDRGVAEVIIGKQRKGAIGTVRLKFINEYTRFEDLSTH